MKLGEEPLPTTPNFVYLGSCISNSGNIDREIQNRIYIAARAFGALLNKVWLDKDLHLQTKIAIFNATVVPCLLYGSESWTTYQPHIQRLESFHLRCLMIISGTTWRDMTPNSEVLEKTQCTSIAGMISLARLKWLGHTSRMEDTRIPKRLMYGELAEGSRPQKKLKKRWKDCVKEDLKAYKLEKSWSTSCLVRPKWRASLHEGQKAFERETGSHQAQMMPP